MRLWHKDLISVLPRQQLLAQWRECCCIARNLTVNGTPNHILVNKILEYPSVHFQLYCQNVCSEMISRGYKVDPDVFERLFRNIDDAANKHVFDTSFVGRLYENWHNNRYFWQCYYNLQEKYDCGGIPEEEWEKIREIATHRPIELKFSIN